MSLNDTVRHIQDSIPGVRVLRAKHLKDPAGVAHYEKSHPKMGDERKRIRDEEFGGQKHKPGEVRISVPEGEAWWVRIGIGEDKPYDYEVRMPGSKTVLRSVSKESWLKHECAECGKTVYQNVGLPERETWLCEKCRYALGFLHDSESGSKWNRQHKGISVLHGNGEISNENIGGFCDRHTAPEVREALVSSGVLQTRRDANGNPVQTAVFKSRRHQADMLKEINRRQADAAASGFRGTRGGVKYLRHGGLNPGD